MVTQIPLLFQMVSCCFNGHFMELCRSKDLVSYGRMDKVYRGKNDHMFRRNYHNEMMHTFRVTTNCLVIQGSHARLSFHWKSKT